MLSSDEDEIDEQGQQYLENLSKHASAAGAAAGFQVSATINDVADDDTDSDDDYEPNEETTLESYTTPLDDSNCEIDEYVVFKEIMTSENLFLYVMHMMTIHTVLCSTVLYLIFYCISNLIKILVDYLKTRIYILTKNHNIEKIRIKYRYYINIEHLLLTLVL